MKKVILVLLTIVMLTSCEVTSITKSDVDAKQKLCDINWEIVRYDELFIDSLYCTSKTKAKIKPKVRDKVMDCIREYTEGIDQKYNNPDHVTNLREDQYSNVVKTCNDIFGEKETLQVKE